MSDNAHSGRFESTAKSAANGPSITTLAGLKKETHTAVVQYFAPVVALYNVVASTAGFPTVRWQVEGQADQHKSPK